MILYFKKNCLGMLNFLRKNINYSFCIAPELQKTYELIYQIKDITIIKGLSTRKPHINLNGSSIDLSKYKLVFELIQDLQPKKGVISLYDKQMNLYNQTTPLPFIYNESFYIKISGDLYYIMNNEPIIKQISTQEFKPTFCSPILESVCRQSLNQLPEDEQELVTGDNLRTLLVSNILKHGMEYKLEKIRLKQILKIVDRQLSTFQKQIDELFVRVEIKGNKKMRYFTNLLLAQYGIMHYFIYFHLSWDIMEPITVIFANCDLFIAYYFFIMKGRDWSLEEIHKSYIEQRKWAFLQKNGINVQKYKQLLQIKQHVEFRLALLSKNPYQLVKQLKKPIKLLDTR